MRTLLSIIVVLLGTITMAKGGGSSIGPGNPAAKNCYLLEGKSEIFESEGGQAANCVLDEWHLFLEMSKRGLVKEHHYPDHPVTVPNPATVNCIDSGGVYRGEETPEGTKGLCVIEEWTLFRIIDITKE